jgi:hypothetical protein
MHGLKYLRLFSMLFSPNPKLSPLEWVLLGIFMALATSPRKVNCIRSMFCLMPYAALERQ